MSNVNRFRDHLVVLPEDDANLAFVNGLELNPRLRPRHIDVLDPAGGWTDVLEAIDPASKRSRIKKLADYPRQHLLLLIDFDTFLAPRQTMYANLKAALPAASAARVYLLGTLETPEKFKAACQHQASEQLGRRLSEDCPPSPQGLWTHAHLQHNAIELARVVAQVRPFLFEP